jgi:hypothetical protein
MWPPASHNKGRPPEWPPESHNKGRQSWHVGCFRHLTCIPHPCYLCTCSVLHRYINGLDFCLCLCSVLHRYINGLNYSQTLESWLARHDHHRQHILPLMEATYGGPQAGVTWWVAWGCSLGWGHSVGGLGVLWAWSLGGWPVGSMGWGHSVGGLGGSLSL